MEDNTFQWSKVYPLLANKLLQYNDNREELIGLLEQIYEQIDLKYPFISEGAPLSDIDPFSVLGTFNRGITNENRTKIIALLAEEWGVKENLPTAFPGIPVLPNTSAWFISSKGSNIKKSIKNLWELFEEAIILANNPDSIEAKENFVSSFDKVANQTGIKWNITMGLYWIRPYFYLNLDSKNRSYLKDNGILSTIKK